MTNAVRNALLKVVLQYKRVCFPSGFEISLCLHSVERDTLYFNAEKPLLAI